MFTRHGFQPQTLRPNWLESTARNPELKDKLFAVRKELRDNIAVNIPHWKNNLTKQEREEIQELKSNPNIKVLPTDKNLGPALLSTDWVQAETIKHLHDELSHREVTQ